MKKLVLYTASTDIHLLNFHVPYIELLSKIGYEVHVACNGNNKIPFAAKQYKIPFQRSPLNKRNFYSYKILKGIIDNNNYALVHCHTPSCGTITRLAARNARKKGTKVIYTAHGFHFYKGAPLKNWLTFYPIEVLLSYITDGIITMNIEDYRRLNSSIFKSKSKYLIDGIGINPTRLQFDETELLALKEELQIDASDIIVLYIAEFIPRKNHQFIFQQIRKITERNSKIKFLFSGGFASEKLKLEKMAIKEGVDDKVRFLGYRNDIGRIIAIAHLGVSSSKAEGLPIGVLELMYNNIPVIASNIRGHTDIITDAENGYLFDFDQAEKFRKKVLELSDNNQLRENLGYKAKQSIEKFLLPNAVKNMSLIYDDFLD